MTLEHRASTHGSQFFYRGLSRLCEEIVDDARFRFGPSFAVGAGLGTDWFPVPNASLRVEATGRLHHAWVAELERRWPGSVRLFAPSETQAARTQLGSRRFKTDDRDCAALVWLVRQGAGRPAATDTLGALVGAVRHRRGLGDDAGAGAPGGAARWVQRDLRDERAGEPRRRARLGRGGHPQLL